MTIHIKVSGVWKEVTQPHVKVSGTWKEAKQVFVKVSGVWEEVFDSYTYDWLLGDWSTCSESCGYGTQTRTVQCQRETGEIVDDSRCTTTKPDTSQTCIIEFCEVCRYILYTDYWYCYPYSSTHLVEIHWNGSEVYYSINSGSNCDLTTTVTTGGAKYRRTGSIIGPGTYTVCRQQLI